MILLALPASAQSAKLGCRRGSAAAALALVPHLHAGDSLSNVVAYTVSFKAPGYSEVVTQQSATATYIVTDPDPDRLAFDASFRADGEGNARVQIDAQDRRHVRCVDGTCEPYTDASGVVYNPVMWGDAPNTLCDGARWTVTFDQPWGTGPVGSQTVTVLRVDPEGRMAMLRRDGTGTGAFAHDSAGITLTRNGEGYRVKIVPGAARWTGYTIFRAGVVIADALLIERRDVLTSPELGRIEAMERQYVLVNAVPRERP